MRRIEAERLLRCARGPERGSSESLVSWQGLAKRRTGFRLLAASNEMQAGVESRSLD